MMYFVMINMMNIEYYPLLIYYILFLIYNLYTVNKKYNIVYYIKEK